MNAALMVLWDPTESTGKDSLVSCTRLGNQTGSKTFQEHHFKAHSFAGCSSISGVCLFYNILPNSSSQWVSLTRVSHLENSSFCPESCLSGSHTDSVETLAGLEPGLSVPTRGHCSRQSQQRHEGKGGGEWAWPTLDNLRTTSLLPLPMALNKKPHRRPRSASSCRRARAKKKNNNCGGEVGGRD